MASNGPNQSRSEHGTQKIRSEEQQRKERRRRGRRSRLDDHGLPRGRQQSGWCRCRRSARDEKSRLQRLRQRDRPIRPCRIARNDQAFLLAQGHGASQGCGPGSRRNRHRRSQGPVRFLQMGCEELPGAPLSARHLEPWGRLGRFQSLRQSRRLLQRGSAADRTQGCRHERRRECRQGSGATQGASCTDGSGEIRRSPGAPGALRVDCRYHGQIQGHRIRRSSQGFS